VEEPEERGVFVVHTSQLGEADISYLYKDFNKAIMMYIGSVDRLKTLIGEKREEIAQSARKASEAISVLQGFCYPTDEMNEFELYENRLNLGETRRDPELESKIHGRDFLFELLNAYIEYTDPKERESRMMEFAETYQRPYEDVKEVLKYMGLDV